MVEMVAWHASILVTEKRKEMYEEEQKDQQKILKTCMSLSFICSCVFDNCEMKESDGFTKGFVMARCFKIKQNITKIKAFTLIPCSDRHFYCVNLNKCHY